MTGCLWLCNKPFYSELKQILCSKPNYQHERIHSSCDSDKDETETSSEALLFCACVSVTQCGLFRRMSDMSHTKKTVQAA